LKKLIEFIKKVRLELKKVTWPNRHEIASATKAVIVSSIICGIYIGLCDLACSKLLKYLLK